MHAVRWRAKTRRRAQHMKHDVPTNDKYKTVAAHKNMVLLKRKRIRRIKIIKYWDTCTHYFVYILEC